MNNAQFVRWFNYLYTLVYNNLLNNQRVHHIMVCPIISTCIPIVCIYICISGICLYCIHLYVYIYIYTWIFHSWLSEKNATVEEICIYIYIYHNFTFIYIYPPQKSVSFTKQHRFVHSAWMLKGARRPDWSSYRAGSGWVFGDFSPSNKNCDWKIPSKRLSISNGILLWDYITIMGFCYGIIINNGII